ncbi:MAG: FAD-binding oxidoreductase [Planctomycetes bacterium]|nr:FAD-binding oxidoreductase [Planctomycetota bacterium]
MTGAVVTALRALLGDGGVLTERHDVARYETGWRYGSGRAFAVALPATPQQVADVLRACAEHGVRVQPLGANTGLVGASNPDATGEQLVLSLERLNATIDVDPIDAVAVVDAGVLLSQLQAALEPHGLWFPIDLGADPQIGGMVVTNTGGTRLLRYGDVRRNLLGIEVALPDGTLVERLQRLRKNNTGLDFKQLFVGTSGAYGVVTRATLQLGPLPRQRATAFVAAGDGQAVLDLLASLTRAVGDVLTAFEVISHDALEITLRRGHNLRTPFRGELPAYAALVELASTFGPERLDLQAALEEALVAHAEGDPRGGIVDVLIGDGEDFWAIRHQITESVREEGRVLAFDVAVPRARLAEFTEAVRAALAQAYPFVRLCDYGHWGDGGSHLNLVWDRSAAPADEASFWSALQTLVYDLCVHGFDGSFSAEHGVGPHNHAFYRRYVPAPVQRAARALKEHFDPQRRLSHRYPD